MDERIRTTTVVMTADYADDLSHARTADILDGVGVGKVIQSVPIFPVNDRSNRAALA